MISQAGIVLCGGASRRMGRPKADLPFGDEALLQRVVRIVGEAVAPVFVVAGPHQALPAFPKTRLKKFIAVRDEEEFAGPLSGLARAMNRMSGERACFVTGCDAPFLTRDIVMEIWGACGRGGAAVPVVGGEPRPLPAAYDLSLRSAINRLLDRGERSLRALLREVPWTPVGEDSLRRYDPELAAFTPLNTPAEYEAALQRLAAAPTLSPPR